MDHQDVADIAFHLGRNVGVIFIHVEAVDADAAGLDVADRLRPRGLGDVVDFEAAIVVGRGIALLQTRNIGFLEAELFRELGVGRLAPQQFGQACAHGR